MDKFNRDWIIENSIEICSGYDDGVLTLRGVHYKLVGLGMPNTKPHYKRVVAAMIIARRKSVISYDKFSDFERQVIGKTDYDETDLDDAIETGKLQVKLWMTNHWKNRWENQDVYLEVWVEKKTMIGIFQPVCKKMNVALCPCKGYPSLTFLNEAAERFRVAEMQGKTPVMVYFGDHDPSGEDIPRSIKDNFSKDFDIDIKVDIYALSEKQCLDLNLPAAPVNPKDVRVNNFEGLGQIELDAVSPEMMADWCNDAITKYFDEDLHEVLEEQEAEERAIYREALKEYVDTL
jgi:hypothetical protein